MRRGAVAVLVTFLAGCREPPPRLAPVQGRVLFGGSPLAGAAVEFIPEPDGGARPSSGAVTDRDGHFTLRCPRFGRGAVVGRHRVTVVYPGKQGPPARYADPRTTPLRVEVPEDGTSDLELILDDAKMCRRARPARFSGQPRGQPLGQRLDELAAGQDGVAAGGAGGAETLGVDVRPVGDDARWRGAGRGQVAQQRRGVEAGQVEVEEDAARGLAPSQVEQARRRPRLGHGQADGAGGAGDPAGEDEVVAEDQRVGGHGALGALGERRGVSPLPSPLSPASGERGRG
jgi:hypothetical protein